MTKMNIATYGIGLAIVMGLVSVGTLYMAKNMVNDAPPKIATVNVDMIINNVKESNRQRLEQASNGNQMAFDAVRQAVMEETVTFAKKFDLAVSTVSKECNCVLLRKDMILTDDVNDLTDRVSTLLKSTTSPTDSAVTGSKS